MKKYNYQYDFDRKNNIGEYLSRVRNNAPINKFWYLRTLTEYPFASLTNTSSIDMPMTFKEYYKYYLTLHTNINCIRLHFLGQICTIAFIAFIIINSFWILIPLVPFVVYPFAWLGHYLFEKNKPLAFKSPIKAKLCDWIMFYNILKGKIKII